MITYTHVGRLGYTGHYAVQLDTIRKPGKRHALNLDGYRTYKALCGVIVPLDSDDHQASGQHEVSPAGDGGRVTCKRCLIRTTARAGE
jgi:hypothetical protein